MVKGPLRIEGGHVASKTAVDTDGLRINHGTLVLKDPQQVTLLDYKGILEYPEIRKHCIIYIRKLFPCFDSNRYCRHLHV